MKKCSSYSKKHEWPKKTIMSFWLMLNSVSSVLQSCLTLCNPWTAICQASVSITNFQSLLRLMSIESVMPSNHLIFCHSFLLPPSFFPSIRVFSMSQLFTSGGQSIGVSASTSVPPVNTYSVQFSRSVVSDSLRPHESQHARPPCPSPTPRVHSN